MSKSILKKIATTRTDQRFFMIPIFSIFFAWISYQFIRYFDLFVPLEQSILAYVRITIFLGLNYFGAYGIALAINKRFKMKTNMFILACLIAYCTIFAGGTVLAFLHILEARFVWIISIVFAITGSFFYLKNKQKQGTKRDIPDILFKSLVITLTGIILTAATTRAINNVGIVVKGPVDVFFFLGFIERIVQDGVLFGKLPDYLRLLGPVNYIYPPASNIITGSMALVTGIEQWEIYKLLFILGNLLAVVPMSMALSKLANNKLVGPIVSGFIFLNMLTSDFTQHTGQWVRMFAYFPISLVIYFFAEFIRENNKRIWPLLSVSLLLVALTSVYPFIFISAIIGMCFLLLSITEKSFDRFKTLLKVFSPILLFLCFYVPLFVGKSEHMNGINGLEACPNGLISLYCNESNISDASIDAAFPIIIWIGIAIFTIPAMFGKNDLQAKKILIGTIIAEYLLMHAPFFGIGPGVAVLAQFQTLPIAIGILICAGFAGTYSRIKRINNKKVRGITVALMIAIVFYTSSFVPIIDSEKILGRRINIFEYTYYFNIIRQNTFIEKQNVMKQSIAFLLKNENDLFKELRNRDYEEDIIFLSDTDTEINFTVANSNYSTAELSLLAHEKITLAPFKDESLNDPNNHVFLSVLNHETFTRYPHVFIEDFRSSDPKGMLRMYVKKQ